MKKSMRKPKKSSNTSEGIDRINSLPDDVLHNILSSLCVFDVVKLSVLSKRWKNIWTTMPYLHFDIEGFCGERIKRFSYLEVPGTYKDFINWVLISQRDTELVSFLLHCQDKNIFDKITILRWIRAATMRNVQELVSAVFLDEPS
ncbi:hypothetical protein P3S68_020550 [Capsicum galapagoense]